MYEMRDPFPAPVLPLADFPRLAGSLGISDVYGVFLDFMAGILGLRQNRGDEPGPIEGLDLSGVLSYEGIRAHAGLYPGGGLRRHGRWLRGCASAGDGGRRRLLVGAGCAPPRTRRLAD